MAEARRKRELQHYRQLHFERERRHLEHEYDIVMQLKDVGPVFPMGNMEFPVKNKVDVDIGVANDAFEFSYIGVCAVIYRLKT
jgi:hypothetical protein